MKYKVTDKHELLKEGITLEYYQSKFLSKAWAHEFSRGEINDWIESGWIEEVQKAEFTKRDMISFGNWCINDYIRQNHCIDIQSSFKRFREYKINESNENKNK